MAPYSMLPALPSLLSPRQRYFARREFVRRTAYGVMGLSLTQLLTLENEVRAATGSHPRGQASRVLVLLEQGGLSHVDTFDPKPEQASDHRSPFKPIRTVVPGMEFTELLSKTAKVADRLAIVRGMHHTVDDHPKGTAYMLQGNNPNNPLKYPDMGCVVGQEIGTPCAYLPPYIMIPGNSEQAYNTTHGFLPAGRAVFKTEGRDLSDPNWSVAGLQPRVSVERTDRRRRLLDRVETPFLDAAGRTPFDAAKTAYEQAFNAVMSPAARAAFDLSLEPRKLREEYGIGHRGHCYLLGRRLIEAGVRFVTVDVRWPQSGVPKDGENLNWDHHDLIYTNGSCGAVRDKCGGEGRYGIATWPMMGSVDQGLSALIRDMDDRGLLADTLVCFVTEFGRTPTLNRCAGRDHWPRAYSIALAGAGIRGGQVIGATDRVGGEVTEQPHTPEDYGETVYRKLGIDTSRRLIGPGERPVDFTDGGRAIPELF